MADREPWLAVLLSLVFPGAGHAYVGERRSAAVVALVAFSLTGAGTWLLLSPTGSVLAGWVALGLVPLVLVGSAWHSHARARALAAPEFDAVRRSQRDGWKAVWLSDLLPGVGQCYAGRWKPGVLLVLASIVLSMFDKVGAAYAAQLAMRAFAIWDAWHGGAIRRATAATTVRIVLLVLIAQPLAQAGVTLFVRSNWVQAFRQPSESMLPTLHPGDYVFVDRTRRGRAEAGDIVAFPFPPDPSKQFLKRCIAAGGQTVEVRHKEVYLDGQKLVEPYVQHVVASEDPEGYTPRDNDKPPTVPPGMSFMMGDNRDNSYDSRFWGPVETRSVLGRAYKIYWPLDRAGPIRRP